MTKITAITWRGVADPRLKSADELTWDDLPDWLALLAEGVDSKESAKCYSLVTLVDADAGRRRTNIALVHAISLDFDSSAPPWDVLEGYEYVAYTTPSHTVAAPRWRVHMPLMHPVKPDVYRHSAESLIERLSLDVDHAASCDAARLWFSPLETSDLKVNSGAPVPVYFDHPTAVPAPRATAAPDLRAWPVEAVAELVGQQWTDGVKHNTARALGGYLARRGWDDDSIMSVIEAQPSDATAKRVAYALGAAERARTDLSAPGWGELQQMFGDVWCQSLAAAARHPDEPADWHLSGQPWSAWWARNAARLEARLKETKAELQQAQADMPPLLVGFGKDWWVRDDRDGGYHASVPRVNLRLRLTNLGHDIYKPEGKSKMSVDDICEAWGVLAESVEHHFAARGIQWDASRRVLVIGHKLPVIEAKRDAAVEAWLAALFGDGLDAAKQWISACQPRHTNRLTACLILVGPRSCGKTLLFTALANMWGCREPVAMRDACVRFNGPTVKSPIVLDDECTFLQQAGLTSQEFLERIQQRSRYVELKGQEKVELVGAQRSGITANNVDTIRFHNVRGVETLQAAGERMSWHTIDDPAAAKAALNRFRASGALVDLDRVKSHFAWLWESVTIDESARFIGTFGGEDAEKAIQQELVDRYGEVYEAMLSLIEGREKWGKAMMLGTCEDFGMILVNPVVLASALELRHGPRMTQQHVSRAVRAISHDSSSVRRRVGDGSKGVNPKVSVWRVLTTSIPGYEGAQGEA